MDIDGAAVAEEVVAPDALEQHIARQCHAAVSHQAGEQVELFLRQCDLTPIAPDAPRAGVDPHIAGIEHLAVHQCLTIGAAQDGADARQQLAQAEWLGDVIVGAEFEAGDAVDLVLAGGEHQDRRITLLAQDAADRESVQPWQHDVEDDQIGAVAPRPIQRRHAIAGVQHRVPLALEVVAQRLGERRIVFYQQDRRHGTPLVARVRRRNGRCRRAGPHHRWHDTRATSPCARSPCDRPPRPSHRMPRRRLPRPG